jgi:phage terminase large subunit GpA-like protein
MTRKPKKPEARPLWTTDERRAWNPPERIKPSEWAERHRVLTTKDTRQPGAWQNDRAPYLRGIMDIPVAPGVSHADIEKASQGGISEAVRNLIAWFAAVHADPVALALPTEDKGRRIMSNRVLPMFRNTPDLAILMTDKAWDLNKGQVALQNGFLLHAMWSGSPASMSSDPARAAFLDEFDEFATNSGEHWNPSGQIEKRLTTYEGISLVMHVSTPTVPYAGIHQRIETCDIVLRYFVPCPRCGAFQRLVFANLRYDETIKALPTVTARSAAVKRRPHAVWYECAHCRGRILPEEHAEMVRAGHWSTDEGFVVDADGVQHVDAETVERWPEGSHIGFKIWRAYWIWSPETCWRNIVAEWIEASGDFEKTYTFTTETLGEPMEERIERAALDTFSAKCARAELEEGIVPRWAKALLATVDTQHDHFYIVIRAWGPSMKSARVWHGQVASFSDLDHACFVQTFAMEGGGEVKVGRVLIDTGGTRLAGEDLSRTSEVYAWIWPRRSVVTPIKGASRIREAQRYWWGQADLDNAADKPRRGRDKNARQMRLCLVNTHLVNDELEFLINRGLAKDDDTEEAWLLNRHDDPDYNHHMTNVVKNFKRKPKPHSEWEPVSPGARVDYRDCEVYQVVGAYLYRIHLIGSEQPEGDEAGGGQATAPPPKRPAPERRRSGWDTGGDFSQYV